MSEVMAAARKDDFIEHNLSQVMRIIGQIIDGFATAWAASAAIRVAARVLRIGLVFTGVGGVVVLGASIIVEFGIGKIIDYTADSIGTSIKYPGIWGISKGSINVGINGLPAARGGPDGDPAGCHGGRVRHGSQWVSINEKPASRLQDWTNCSGMICKASPDVFVGGPQVEYDRESPFQSVIKWGFKGHDLVKAFRTGGVPEALKEGTKIGGDQLLDAAWGAIFK